MKKRIFITAIILLTAGFSFQQLNGQEKSQDQKDKDAKLQQAIEMQKKQMIEQKKQQENDQKDLEKAMQDAKESVLKSTGEANEYYRRIRPSVIGRDFNDQSFFVTPGVDFGGDAFFRHGGDNERTTWDFSKYVKEATFTKSYSFDVEKSVGTVVMTVMGDCKSGEIRVKIVMPGGKTYSDIVIDESGNLNWRKSFTISDEENKDKAGEWTFKIDAAKATGSFKISLQTY